MASLGQASSHNPQKIQRNILISYTTAYFSSRYISSSPFLRSPAVIVMASAGHDNAHNPQAVQRSLPSSSRFSECCPRKFLEYGRISSGYLIVGIFLKKCFIVIDKPFAIAGKYILSQKLIGFCSNTFFLFDKGCIPNYLKYSSTTIVTTPVNTIFAIARGINIFHPKFINWSYLNLGKVHLIHIKKKINPKIFKKNTKTPIMVIQFSESPKSYMNGKL